jgi:hypothetical protein
VKNANAMVGSETREQCIPYPSSNTPLQRTPDGSTLFFFEFLFIRNYCYIAREESSPNHLAAVFKLFTLLQEEDTNLLQNSPLLF